MFGGECADTRHPSGSTYPGTLSGLRESHLQSNLRRGNKVDCFESFESFEQAEKQKISFFFPHLPDAANHAAGGSLGE